MTFDKLNEWIVPERLGDLPSYGSTAPSSPHIILKNINWVCGSWTLETP